MAFKVGFDKPLNARWRFFLPELVAEIKASIRREFDTAGGEFTRSWSLKNVHVAPGEESVIIESNHPFAFIQEMGGRVPDRYPVRAKAMHWMSGGEHVFAKRAKGFTLRPRGFIAAAVTKWAATEKGVDVEWKD